MIVVFRLAGAFVSIQLEKASFRDEMLNAFLKKKEQTGTLKLNSVCNIKGEFV